MQSLKFIYLFIIGFSRFLYATGDLPVFRPEKKEYELFSSSKCNCGSKNNYSTENAFFAIIQPFCQRLDALFNFQIKKSFSWSSICYSSDEESVLYESDMSSISSNVSDKENNEIFNESCKMDVTDTQPMYEKEVNGQGSYGLLSLEKIGAQHSGEGVSGCSNTLEMVHKKQDISFNDLFIVAFHKKPFQNDEEKYKKVVCALGKQPEYNLGITSHIPNVYKNLKELGFNILLKHITAKKDIVFTVPFFKSMMDEDTLEQIEKSKSFISFEKEKNIISSSTSSTTKVEEEVELQIRAQSDYLLIYYAMFGPEFIRKPDLVRLFNNFDGRLKNYNKRPLFFLGTEIDLLKSYKRQNEGVADHFFRRVCKNCSCSFYYDNQTVDFFKNIIIKSMKLFKLGYIDFNHEPNTIFTSSLNLIDDLCAKHSSSIFVKFMLLMNIYTSLANEWDEEVVNTLCQNCLEKMKPLFASLLYFYSSYTNKN